MGKTITFYGTDQASHTEEARRRVDAQGIIDDFCAMPVEISDESLNQVIPIPNTGDVLGYFKLETNLDVAYKKYGEFVWEDLLAVQTFWRNWVELERHESSLL